MPKKACARCHHTDDVREVTDPRGWWLCAFCRRTYGAKVKR